MVLKVDRKASGFQLMTWSLSLLVDDFTTLGSDGINIFTRTEKVEKEQVITL